ncbi:MAG: Ig-like domain-containing protein [Gemmatimonadaceae bacterium]
MSKRKLSILAVIVASLTIACSDSVAPPSAATIVINSVADQEGFAGEFVFENPEILVLDASGQPVQGVTVKFAVTEGGGSVSNATTISGPQGRASAGAWTLGPSIGENAVVGSVDGVGSIRFKAEGVPVPTGTFQLTTIDGFPLPFRWPPNEDLIIGGTFTLTGAKAYSFVERVRTVDGAEIQGETVGKFAPKGADGFSFYLNGFPWIDGKLEGDKLTLGVWDDSDLIHVYEFAKESPND